MPVVIYDAGGTPIGDLLDSVVEEGSASAKTLTEPPSPPPAVAMTAYPVVTTKAGPGRLPGPTRGNLKGGPGVPLCVVGDDALSLQWLRLNAVALQRMKATCLVASVRDEAGLQRLRASAGTVSLTPGSFDALATATGIKVWPILVSPDGVVSQ